MKKFLFVLVCLMSFGLLAQVNDNMYQFYRSNDGGEFSSSYYLSYGNGDERCPAGYLKYSDIGQIVLENHGKELMPQDGCTESSDGAMSCLPVDEVVDLFKSNKLVPIELSVSVSTTLGKVSVSVHDIDTHWFD